MKKKKPADSKAWASFRIRGIQTTLENLEINTELSVFVRRNLSVALDAISRAVNRLDEEREANEAERLPWNKGA